MSWLALPRKSEPAVMSDADEVKAYTSAPAPAQRERLFEMKRLFVVLAWLLVAAGLAAKEKPQATYTIPMPPQPDFRALDWLIGKWEGPTTGRKPQGEIRLAASYDLDRRFMILRQKIDLPPTKKSPGVQESWMGILSKDRTQPGFLLRIFSSTGFMTRYRVIVEGGQMQFNPEGGEEPPPGWLFRYRIVQLSDTELNLTVQAAPPGKPFFDYYIAKLTRQPAP